mmetsp:Transcript_54960/g.164636  ORF Transcript_54960/g.164636 Transcript_54960/m.164636 type:complete len:1336 (-) Transcript_54960:32-4039(-)
MAGARDDESSHGTSVSTSTSEGDDSVDFDVHQEGGACPRPVRTEAQPKRSRTECRRQPRLKSAIDGDAPHLVVFCGPRSAGWASENERGSDRRENESGGHERQKNGDGCVSTSAGDARRGIEGPALTLVTETTTTGLFLAKSPEAAGNDERSDGDSISISTSEDSSSSAPEEDSRSRRRSRLRPRKEEAGGDFTSPDEWMYLHQPDRDDGDNERRERRAKFGRQRWCSGKISADSLMGSDGDEDDPSDERKLFASVKASIHSSEEKELFASVKARIWGGKEGVSGREETSIGGRDVGDRKVASAHENRGIIILKRSRIDAESPMAADRRRGGSEVVMRPCLEADSVQTTPVANFCCAECADNSEDHDEGAWKDDEKELLVLVQSSILQFNPQESLPLKITKRGGKGARGGDRGDAEHFALQEALRASREQMRFMEDDQMEEAKRRSLAEAVHSPLPSALAGAYDPIDEGNLKIAATDGGKVVSTHLPRHESPISISSSSDALDSEEECKNAQGKSNAIVVSISSEGVNGGGDRNYGGVKWPLHSIVAPKKGFIAGNGGFDGDEDSGDYSHGSWQDASSEVRRRHRRRQRERTAMVSASSKHGEPLRSTYVAPLTASVTGACAGREIATTDTATTKESVHVDVLSENSGHKESGRPPNPLLPRRQKLLQTKSPENAIKRKLKYDRVMVGSPSLLHYFCQNGGKGTSPSKRSPSIRDYFLPGRKKGVGTLPPRRLLCGSVSTDGDGNAVRTAVASCKETKSHPRKYLRKQDAERCAGSSSAAPQSLRLVSAPTIPNTVYSSAKKLGALPYANGPSDTSDTSSSVSSSTVDYSLLRRNEKNTKLRAQGKSARGVGAKSKSMSMRCSERARCHKSTALPTFTNVRKEPGPLLGAEIVICSREKGSFSSSDDDFSDASDFDIPRRRLKKIERRKRKRRRSSFIDRSERSRHCSKRSNSVKRSDVDQLDIKSNGEAEAVEAPKCVLHCGGLFSLDEFTALWTSAVQKHMGGCDIDAIEKEKLIRQGNNEMYSSHQKMAMYGRVKEHAFQRVIDLLELTNEDIFIDIGHGCGNAPIQAAFTTGCEARGIEILEGRFTISDILKRSIKEERDTLPDSQKKKVGLLTLRRGNFTDPSHQDFITSCNKLFVNNAEEIFGSRSVEDKKRTLNSHLAGLFALMKPGTTMVTFERILELGRSCTEENNARKMRGLPESADASFFDCKCHSLGSNAVTWSQTNELNVWVHRRVRQSHQSAVFLCTNKKCKARNDAVENAREALLREKCAYCKQPRLSPPRQTAKCSSESDSDNASRSTESDPDSQIEESSSEGNMSDDSTYQCSKSCRR